MVVLFIVTLVIHVIHLEYSTGEECRGRPERLPLYGPLEKAEVLNLPENYTYYCGYVSESVDKGSGRTLCSSECEIDPLCIGK